ncbi:cation:proton antiporter, partial [Actinomadura adrarensis]
GGSAATAAYYVAASLVFFAVTVVFGPRLFRWLTRTGLAALDRHNPTALRLLFLFAGVLCCAGLGINPIFGALMAGVSAARGDAAIDDLQAEGRALHAWEAMRHFALAFFVPVYFAVVGLRLDLIDQFDPLFFAWFLILACTVKGMSVWGAARLTGENQALATRLAVALNARGTLGVLLATVTLHAGIIDAGFFTVLVVMSIVTCQIAGFFLDRAFRSKEPGAQRRRAPAPQEVR